MRQLAGLLLGTLLCGLLAGCQDVPSLTSLPVPSDGNVLNGSYSGSFVEPASPEDARVSPDGRSVYLLQGTPGPHTLLIRLDAATGQEVQRQTLAVPSPHQLAFAPDGAILIAGIGHSLAVDPTTLQPLRSLLGGTFSSDGTRLLVYYPGTSTDRPRFDRQDTVTGALIPSQGPEDLPDSEAFVASQDETWVSFNAGKALQNLDTGQRLSVTGLPVGCSASPRVQELAVTPQGFLLAESDGTLHWLDRSGRQLNQVSLGGGCPSTEFPAVALNPDGVSFRLIAGTSSPALVSWTPGQAPTIQMLAPQAVPLPSSVAHSPEVLLLQASADQGTVLNNMGRWTKVIPAPDGKFTANFKAAYQDASTYAITGTVQIEGQTLVATGTGRAVNDPSGPQVVFTQQVCSGTGLYAPRCPSLSWMVDLTLNGAAAGQFGGELDLSGPQTQRQVQLGEGQISTLNQEGVDGYRSIYFSLTPQ